MSGAQLALMDLAKYPFLSEAGDHIRSLSLTIEDMAGPDFASVVERAKQRVKEAIRLRRVSEAIREPEAELLSFPLALVMVKATGLEHLVSRYALSEALRVERLLGLERSAVISYIFKTALNIEVAEVKGSDLQAPTYRMPLPDFLTRSTRFHEPRWKLINRMVESGYVHLRVHDLIRLIREEIHRIILSKVRSISVPRLPKGVEEAVREIVSTAPPPPSRQEWGAAPAQYPPCVRRALDMLQRGENVPHFARFLMTTYLLSVGKSVDDIVALYPHAPDFSERMTRYQVEHVAGLRGGRVKYRVPSCRTVVSHSFCFKDDTYCPHIRNPLQYGRGPPAKTKRRRRESADG